MAKIPGIVVLFALILVSCQSKNDKVIKTDIVADHIDTTVTPGSDFFMYANGRWLKENPIPDDQSGWGIAYMVADENLKRLRTISEKAATAMANSESSERKIGDFWKTAMDSVKIERLGLSPLQPYLKTIDSISSGAAAITVSARFRQIGSVTFFGNYVTQDDKNSTSMMYILLQGGIMLPEREYYLKNDSSMIDIRRHYLAHIATLLTMAGQDSAKAGSAATDVLAFETRLAKASRKLEDLRDPYLNYNKIAVRDLPAMVPAIDWKTYRDITGINKVDSILVGQPDFFKALSRIITEVPVEVLKQYMRFNLIADFSMALSDRFGKEVFNFNKNLSGEKQQKPRWKRVVRSENDYLGELLGQLYVKEYFSDTARKRYENMVEAMRETMRERIGKLDWMSDSTKRKAYAKLSAMKKKIGYPDKWKDFSTMQIDTISYVQNIISANKWWQNYEISKIGKPVDPDEWYMTPQTFNAYYDVSKNEIVLPAAQMTIPGYRDEEIDDALAYGYVAASVIGHELIHGFDDYGKQYDAHGNLVNWWTKKDEEEFAKRASGLIFQFNDYKPLPGYSINGKATLGENIADLGGLVVGLETFKKTDTYKKNLLMQGQTPIQRFFLGFSLSWLEKRKDESLRTQLVSDFHSPPSYRVNGPFVNVDEFYSAFAIKTDDKIYRPDSIRVKIW